jgi:hypothetical protein
VRGPLRWAQTTKLRIAERPPHPRPPDQVGGHSTSPHGRRGEQTKPFSRRIRARASPCHSQGPPKEGRQSADRRVVHETAPAGAAAPSVFSSACLRKIRRGLASRRSTAALATQINAMAQSRPVSWDVRAAGITRSPLSQSSEAPRRPVIMPADAMPGPPGSGVTSPARRNRTRSTSRMSREYLVLRRLFRRRISRGRPAGRRGRRRGARRRTAAMERAQRIRPNRAGPLAEQSLPQAKLAA